MDVCVLGSINRDVVCRVSALPRAGETVAAYETLLLPGGKGANQAVAAARIGATTRMIGAVGSDADGVALAGGLADEGIDVAHVARLADVATGAAYIALDRAGENQIVVAPGANARVTAAAAAAGAAQPARVFLAQLETPVAAVAAFFAAARGVRMLNAAPALPEGEALFADADVLIFNQSELTRYLGLAAEPETPDDAAAARALLTRAGQAAIVTLGAQGAVYVTADALIAVPGVAVAVVDTTGAGDCFCGALAALVAEGVPVARAMAQANAAAALCVGRSGAVPAMPYRRELATG